MSGALQFDIKDGSAESAAQTGPITLTGGGITNSPPLRGLSAVPLAGWVAIAATASAVAFVAYTKWR